MFVAESGARQDDRSESGVGDVDGHAGRNQFSLARLQRQWRFKAGAQVEAGGAGGGVLRQLLAQARVEDFDGNGFHGKRVNGEW